MKKVKIDNVWPHDIIKTENGIGQVASVERVSDGGAPAKVEFAWHQAGYPYTAYFYWSTEVVVLSDEDLLHLRN